MSKQTDLLNLTDGISVDASGNVGIGTSSPNSAIHVEKTSAPKIRSTYTGGANLDMVAGATSGYFGTQTNHGLALFTNDTTRMTIDSSGNVGIGTASPAERLHLADTGESRIQFEGSAWQNYIGVTGYDNLVIAADEGQGSANSTIQFRVDAAERMRIDSSGNVLVGTTAASNKWTAGQGSDIGLELRSTQYGLVMHMPYECALLNTDSVTALIRFYYRGSGIGSIATNGSSTAYNTTSDYRLKENITPIQGAGDIVKAMRPVTYTFKSDGSWMDGFIAHEMQELHPVAVTGSKDGMVDEEYEVTPAVEATYDDEGVELTPAVPAVMGTRSVPDYQGVDYSKLTPILTAALQEALNKIDALEAQNAAFEARLTALEAT